MALDDLSRLALFERWSERCVWCARPLIFAEMEVEHLLPKSLTGDERTQVLATHGRPEDFDLDSLENLAPSCGPCNRSKGNRPPPDAPRITTLLRDARERAPEIRDAAERLTRTGRIQKSLAVVLAAADAGDPDTIRRLRSATQEVQLAFTEATGRSLGALHPAMHRMVEVGDLLRRSDPDFSYAATVYETGASAPHPASETVMSVSRVSEAVTTRVDVAPRTVDAMELRGPQFTLSPTEDEAGRQAVAELDAALREGRGAVIRSGLDIVFNRMPVALEDHVGRPMTGGTIRIEPVGRRRVPDWHARIRASNQPRKAAIELVLSQADHAPEGWDDELAGAYGGLTVRVRFRRVGQGGEVNWQLTHVRDRSPVRRQVQALELLEALADGANLIVEDRRGSGRPTIEQRVEPEPLKPETIALLAFLRDLRTIETWRHREFDLPDNLSAAEARGIGAAAHAIRQGGLEITWDRIRLATSSTSVELFEAKKAVRIERTLEVRVFGMVVDLGRTRLDLGSYEVASVKDLSAGQVELEIVPTSKDDANVFERLMQRKSPPPPPPRKAAQARRKSRRNKR